MPLDASHIDDKPSERVVLAFRAFGGDYGIGIDAIEEVCFRLESGHLPPETQPKSHRTACHELPFSPVPLHSVWFCNRKCRVG